MTSFADGDLVLSRRYRLAAWLDASSNRRPVLRIWQWLSNDDRAGIIGLGLLGILLLLLVPPLLRGPAVDYTPGTRVAAATDQNTDFPALVDLPLPEVDPVELVKVDAPTAKRINAGVPFVTGPYAPAKPYRTMLAGDDLQRAVDCLAAAEIYEAGNDPLGEAAVAQVVLNRVRHPAFPDTVCGVVFQGSERRTGCQFTFTCDGSLAARRPRPDAWAKARDIATLALTGTVFARIGLATHYHTDWVVPKWSAQLDKLAAVHTHLFFRWRGPWGTPGAFRREPRPIEPQIDKLAALSDVHKRPEALAALRLQSAAAGMDIRREGNVVLVGLNGRLPPEALPSFAASLCGNGEGCRVAAWQDGRRLPSGRADAEAIAHAAFTYTRAAGDAAGVARWNCQVYKGQPSCMADTDPNAPLAAVAKPAEGAEGALASAADAASATPPSVAHSEPTAEVPETAAQHRRRADPCRAMRNVDDRVGFCAAR